MSKVYHLQRTQIIPCSLEEALSFFSDPNNLSRITPPALKFTVLTKEVAKKMYAVQIIEYRMKPLFNIPQYWMTEITHVSDHYFVDEQRFGPYALWHHQHHFREAPGGTEMTDIVHYKLPFWFLGDIAHALFVRRKLEEIFDYRFNSVKNGIGN